MPELGAPLPAALVAQEQSHNETAAHNAVCIAALR